MEGIVIRSTGSWYIVRTDDGNKYDCRIKGKFRIKGIKSTNPVSVGDKVRFELEEGKETGVINHIFDRQNYIVRKSVNLSKRTHIIASNIDQAFLLVTVDFPQTTTGFIDRFLVSAQAYRIPVVLVFNKIDRYEIEQRAEVMWLRDIYENIGYKCIEISAKENKNIDEIKGLMQGKTSMFAGHSGVGKSTLVNSIQPGLNLKTKEISESHQQGQHTTTFAEMHELDFGGFIIDTPGIRGFGIVDMAKEEISHYFPEIFELSSECKFHNCSHTHEPQCAVLEAVENEEIAPSRYESYLSLIEDDEDDPYRKAIYG